MLKGFKILYWPYAALYHPVCPERLSVNYLHKWYFNLGRSLYILKSTGRIFNIKNKSMLGIEGFISNKLPSIFELLLLKVKIFKVSVFLWLKLFLSILILPLSILLALTKRPFYLTTLFAKTLGEAKQAYFD